MLIVVECCWAVETYREYQTSHQINIKLMKSFRTYDEW